MSQITQWEDAIQMPVIGVPNIRWNLNELEKIFTDSIKKCAEESLGMNFCEICITFSGGLNSSFCLAKIREIFRYGRINTFTLAGNKEHPDFKFSRIVSAMFNARHHAYIPRIDDIERVNRLLSARRSLIFPGDDCVYLLYEYMAERGVKCVIAHDGIDELLGGYRAHKQCQDLDKKAGVFRMFWSELREKHLLPLEKTAKQLGIKVVFPYLQAPVIEYISKIPLNDRTSIGKSRWPLREIALHHLPLCVIKREKKCFRDAL